jgi:hypothetical protein
MFHRDSSRREGLHLLVDQTAPVSENGERIAGKRCPRKNIELNEFVSAGHLVLFNNSQ